MHWTTAALALPLLATTSAGLQMASLGSSFAAGPGIPNRANYAHLAAAQLNASLADLSVSGSTLLTIGSQIARIPANTDIITVTSGGNDLGYVAGLAADSARRQQHVGGRTAPASAQAGLISEDALLRRWGDALARIRARAPRARVYLVEYLTVFGPRAAAYAGSPDVPFDGARVEHHRRVAAALARATARAAVGREAWVVDVPVAKESEAHGVGSNVPWTNGARKGTRGGVAWHPNADGMRAVAEMVVAKIRAQKTGGR
jgi:lysophospholipase L1-like esterase